MVQLLQYLIHRPENLSFYTCNTYLRKKQNIFASLPFFLWSIKTLPRIPYINNKYKSFVFQIDNTLSTQEITIIPTFDQTSDNEEVSEEYIGLQV